MKLGILFRWRSLWIGAHWSPYNRRLCINLLPMITLWIAKENGATPNEGLDIYRTDRAERELRDKEIAKKLRDNEKWEFVIDTLTAHGFMPAKQLCLMRQLTYECVEADTSLDEFKRIFNKAIQQSCGTSELNPEMQEMRREYEKTGQYPIDPKTIEDIMRNF